MKKRALLIIGLVIIGILLITIIGFAAYIYINKGDSTTAIAKPILNVELQDANSDDKIHSWYNVIVKNYNSDGRVSDTGFDYVISVTTTDGSAVPDYTWYDSQNNEIAKNKNLTGSFSTTKSTTNYKLRFYNTGDNEISKKIKLETVATQKKTK